MDDPFRAFFVVIFLLSQFCPISHFNFQPSFTASTIKRLFNFYFAMKAIPQFFLIFPWKLIFFYWMKKSTYSMLSTLSILLDYYNKEIAFAIEKKVPSTLWKKIDFDLQPIHTHFQECIWNMYWRPHIIEQICYADAWYPINIKTRTVDICVVSECISFIFISIPTVKTYNWMNKQTNISLTKWFVNDDSLRFSIFPNLKLIILLINRSGAGIAYYTKQFSFSIMNIKIVIAAKDLLNYIVRSTIHHKIW